MNRNFPGVMLSLLCVCGIVNAQLLGTAFTYQGELKENNVPASGQYDFEFVLFSGVSGGSQLTAPLARNGVPVDAGVFSVQLDFGDQFTGVARFLEIHVRRAGTNQFTVLAPRQQVMPTPYALHAEFVADNTIVTASLQNGAVTTGKIANGAVTTINLADGSVTAAKLASGAIATVDLADGSVTTPKLADAAVTNAKLAANSVGYSQLGGGVVDQTKVNPNGVQLRVAAMCPRGVPLIGIAVSGAPICDHPLRQVAGPNAAYRVSVVVRNDDRPLVAYSNGPLYDCNDANCTTYTAHGVPGASGDMAMTVRASDSFVFVAYANGAEGLTICSDATCGSVAQNRTLDSNGNIAAFSSVALLNDGRAVVAYYDFNSGQARLYVCASVNCSSGSVRVLTTGTHTPAVVRVRPNGTPMVVLRHYSASNDALYDCNDADCTSGTLRAFGTGYGERFLPSAAMRSDNRALAIDAGFSGLSSYDCADASCTSSTAHVIDAALGVSQTAVVVRSTGLALVAYNDNVSTKLLDCADVACSSGTPHVLDQGGGNVQDYEIAVARRADDRPVVAYASHDGGVRLILCATQACQ